MKLHTFLPLLFCVNLVTAHFHTAVVTNFTINVVKSVHTVIFGCDRNIVQHLMQELMSYNQFVKFINMRFNYTLRSILSHTIPQRTTAIVDCVCNGSQHLLTVASDGKYFNTTYQWLLWDSNAIGVTKLLSGLNYLGPNAQITYVNYTKNGIENIYALWDVHSKGLHLHAPLQLQYFASYVNDTFSIYNNIFTLQGIQTRNQFNGLMLRGATVIDQDNVDSNEQIERILVRPKKDSGVAAFTKYHYALLLLLRHRLNFTVNFRNARGWAGRLGETRFRLGYLGIMARNEADIGASAAFNRINRFAEFDIVHQSWKFETAFLYRFTSDLNTGHSSSGNFLAPFDNYVWWLSAGIMISAMLVWFFMEFTKNRRVRVMSLEVSNKRNDTTFVALSLNTFAAICQQGIDPIPHGWSSRTIILSVFLFSLLMYNYYTSSVVGGLLSSNVKGPATVDEIVSSKLKLSFEDIGYYKVLFRENKSPVIRRLIVRKVEPPRDAYDLPIYTHINEAIPFLRLGEFAFHCEVVDAYPEIAKEFNANEICELRAVTGLLETELINFVVSKNCEYTEIFRVVAHRIKEIGIMQRLLHERQPKKPHCQALFTVYSVHLTGVLSAFYILGGGIVLAAITLLFEIWNSRHYCNRTLNFSER